MHTDLLSHLACGPARIAEVTAGLSPAQLRVAPVAGEWSAHEMLAHLRACSDVWGQCITTILTQEQPTIRALSPRSYIRRTNYLDAEFASALHLFTEQRTGLVAQLSALPPDAWARRATVIKSGKVHERTVLAYAEMLANHEEPHLDQITHIVQSLLC